MPCGLNVGMGDAELGRTHAAYGDGEHKTSAKATKDLLIKVETCRECEEDE